MISVTITNVLSSGKRQPRLTANQRRLGVCGLVLCISLGGCSTGDLTHMQCQGWYISTCDTFNINKPWIYKWQALGVTVDCLRLLLWIPRSQVDSSSLPFSQQPMRNEEGEEREANTWILNRCHGANPWNRSLKVNERMAVAQKHQVLQCKM